MNADVTLLNENTDSGEPTADLLIRTSSLKGCIIEGELIPTLIDELPVIAVMACFAEGTTSIRDAAELKVKESDRIAVMTENLTAMGAKVTATNDGMIIEGGYPLHGAVIDSHLDHRIATWPSKLPRQACVPLARWPIGVQASPARSMSAPRTMYLPE